MTSAVVRAAAEMHATSLTNGLSRNSIAYPGSSASSANHTDTTSKERESESPVSPPNTANSTPQRESGPPVITSSPNDSDPTRTVSAEGGPNPSGPPLSEPQQQPPTTHQQQLCMDVPASASPFPSPSSSFLPPPTPGAHEFAMKPPPQGRAGRKGSVQGAGSVRRDSRGDVKRDSNGTARKEEEGSVKRNSSNGNARRDSNDARRHSNDAQRDSNGNVRRDSRNAARDLNCNSTRDSNGNPARDLNGNARDSDVTVKRDSNGNANQDTDSKEVLVKGESEASIPSPLSALDTTSTPDPTLPPKNQASLPDNHPPQTMNGHQHDPSDTSSIASPLTPTPSTFHHQQLSVPPFTSQSDPTDPLTPTPTQSPPKSTTTAPKAHHPQSPSKIIIPDPPSLSLITHGVDPTLTPNRPAPASPASSSASKRFSKSSVGGGLSRASSLRKSTGSPRVNPHRMSLGSQLNANFGLLPSPLSPGFSFVAGGMKASTSTSTAKLTEPDPKERVVVRVRDFGFPEGDERHHGLGVDVPKANKVSRLVRKLGGRTQSVGSVSSSDGGEEEEEEEMDDGGWGGGGGWGGFKMGLGRLSWGGDAGAGSMFGYAGGKQAGGEYPSQMDLDQNFAGGEEEEEEEDVSEEGDVFHEAAEGQDEEEEPLYPGLYRALYAFEPEGTAEMRLEEDQIVRVVGRGGGVGWAVVDVLQSDLSVASDLEPGEGGAEGAEGPRKHALVPESYLEPFRLDWEEEDDGDAVPTIDEEEAVESDR